MSWSYRVLWTRLNDVLVVNKKHVYLHRRQIPQGSSALLQVTKSSFSDGRVLSSVTGWRAAAAAAIAVRLRRGQLSVGDSCYLAGDR